MKLRCPYCRKENERDPRLGWVWICHACPEAEGIDISYSSLWPCPRCGQRLSWYIHDNWPTDDICPECRAAEHLGRMPMPEPAPSDLDAEERAALKDFIREEAEAYGETTWQKQRGYED